MSGTSPRANRILGGLPSEDYERLAPALERIRLDFKQPLLETREQPRHIFFPTTALVSIQHTVDDGRCVEVGSVGREGLAGIRAFLGDLTPFARFVAQIPGDAYRMPADVFVREARRSGPFNDQLLRYTSALLFQFAQWVACNMLHTVEQRCCRWLIMVRDRTDSDQFPLTHEFLAQMLGVRRASVTEVARTLQKTGLIRYRRGEMTILNLKGLETAACPCYARVKTEFTRLMG
jgi:CRP-like cAMP-binding protein